MAKWIIGMMEEVSIVLKQKNECINSIFSKSSERIKIKQVPQLSKQSNTNS
jgi:hypothetical protein